MKFIIRMLVTAAVAYGLALVLSPHVTIDTFGSALLFVFILTLLNAIVRPLLIILTLPITILTLGLFLLVLNVIIVLLAAKFVSGIRVEGFLWALIYGLLLSVISSALLSFDKK